MKIVKSFLFSSIIALGLAFGGYFSAKQISSSKQLIEVKGLSERIVKSDRCTIDIELNHLGDTIESAQAQLQGSVDTILNDLKKINITRDNITIQNRARNRQIEEYTDNKKTTKRKFELEKTITISTNDVSAPAEIENMIPQWLTKNIVVTSCNYEYKLSDFNKLKEEMMKEASQNARDCAKSFVDAIDEKLGELVYLKQGFISVSAADGSRPWNEGQSLEKKLRLVVQAGFKKKHALAD